MTPPRVSVLMPAYQAEPYIREAVTSVLAQTFADLELIVLDDGSTDGTAGVVRAIEDPRVRLLVRPHRGLAAARNELLAEARGEYVAVMDADDIAMPERLARQIAYLEGHPQVGVIGGWSELFGRESRIDGLPVEDAAIRRLLRVGTALSDGAMTARREVMLRAGGYDPAALWVDWDMDLRLAAVTRLHNLPEVVIRYRRHAGSMQEAVPRADGRREKLRRRLQAVRVLGWRPRSLLHVGVPAISSLVYRILDRRGVPPLPPVRTFSVVVPTIGRPELLRRCLEGLANQTRSPDEILIVARAGDAASRDEAIGWASRSARRGVRVITVHEAGQVAALAAGFFAATGDVICMLDDDAVPEPGWLEALSGAYGPFVGGAGGRVRDVVEGRIVRGRARRVGRVGTSGRIVGRMHLDAPPQDVQWVSGGNASYRRALVRLERRLRPNDHGVEFANDVVMGLSVSTRGYRVRFVPEARIVHRSASPREAGTGLRTITAGDVEAAAHNVLLAVVSSRRGLARACAIAFWFAVGTRTAPGPVRVAVGLAMGDLGPLRRLRAAHRGRRGALSSLRRAPADHEVPAGLSGAVAA